MAIPATSGNKTLAADWIAAFTSTANEKKMADAGNIPNASNLAALAAGNPKVSPFARAAKYNWFVPISPNWSNVESGNVLQEMCQAIFTGRKSVRAAATSASNTITRILNTGS